MKHLIPLSILVLSGCASPSEDSRSVLHTELGPGFAGRTEAAPDPRPATVAPAPVEEPADPEGPGRKIIFNGVLALQVADPEATEKKLREAVAKAEGWVHRIQGGTFTLRIPASRFNETMETLAALGRLLDRQVSGRDVTEEYRDLQIRLDNAEQVRRRLAALLERTQNVKEALEVERELARLSEEIERMKGRLQSVADQVAYSTITLTMTRSAPAPAAARDPRLPFPWLRDLGLESLTTFGGRPWE